MSQATYVPSTLHGGVNVLYACHLGSVRRVKCYKSEWKTLGNIKGAYIIADDIIVAGDDEQDHDSILREVLRRAREKNVRFNASKVQLKENKVLYMGHTVSKESRSTQSGSDCRHATTQRQTFTASIPEHGQVPREVYSG